MRAKRPCGAVFYTKMLLVNWANTPASVLLHQVGDSRAHLLVLPVYWHQSIEGAYGVVPL